MTPPVDWILRLFAKQLLRVDDFVMGPGVRYLAIIHHGTPMLRMRGPNVALGNNIYACLADLLDRMKQSRQYIVSIVPVVWDGIALFTAVPQVPSEIISMEQWPSHLDSRRILRGSVLLFVPTKQHREQLLSVVREAAETDSAEDEAE